MLTIVTKDLQNFIRQASNLQKNFIASAYEWVYDLTEFAQQRMQFYVDSGKTHRSTGKLRGSIKTEITVSSRRVRGKSSVGRNIVYQYAVEFGRHRNEYIYPKHAKMLSFKPEDWRQKGNDSEIISRFSGVGGYLYFYRVKTGKYEGKHFTEKAAEDTLRKIDSSAGVVLDKLINRTFVRVGGLRSRF